MQAKKWSSKARLALIQSAPMVGTLSMVETIETVSDSVKSAVKTAKIQRSRRKHISVEKKSEAGAEVPMATDSLANQH